MHIFLDESYNLSDRSKPQFISVNGFMVLDTKPLHKRWKAMRLPFVGKARIHGSDRLFEPLRKKLFHHISRQPDIRLLTVRQDINHIPPKRETATYYGKDGKLIFDNVYAGALKELLKEIHPEAYKEIHITIDSRKHKNSALGKEQFRKNILAFFKNWYPNTPVRFEAQSSTSNILLEIADFVSNTFYKHYVGEDTVFEKLKGKTIPLKNPLK